MALGVNDLSSKLSYCNLLGAGLKQLIDEAASSKAPHTQAGRRGSTASGFAAAGAGRGGSNTVVSGFKCRGGSTIAGRVGSAAARTVRQADRRPSRPWRSCRGHLAT